MTFNDDLIAKVAALAADLTPVSHIAALLSLDEDELRSELGSLGSPLRQAYLKAKAQTALALRRQELEFARIGSPVAIQLTSSYLREMDSDEDF